MKRFLNWLGLNVLPLIINVYIASLRIRRINSPDFTKNSIFIFWHSKMLVGWWLFKNTKSAALVSRSKDGDVLCKVLEKWNYKVVRGSSSKGSKEAVEELSKCANENHSIVITPDGPRGPALELKNGPFIISNLSHIPIIPVKIKYHSKKVFHKSWDSFELPYPFTKCEINFRNEFAYETYLDDENLRRLKMKIAEQM